MSGTSLGLWCRGYVECSMLCLTKLQMVILLAMCLFGGCCRSIVVRREKYDSRADDVANLAYFIEYVYFSISQSSMTV